MPNSALLDQILAKWKPRSISALPQGLTNQGFKLELDSGCYVLRIAATNSQELDINRQAEYRIHQLLEQQQLVPKIIYNDPSYRYWIREYVEGVPLTAQDLNLSTLKKLAVYLQKIHQLVVPDDLPVVDVQKKIQHYQQLLEIPQQHSAFALPSSTFSLCHMDPTPANWLRMPNGKLVLLDWEYAGLGNPLWDMAGLIQQAKLTNEEEMQFLDIIQQENNTAWQQAKAQLNELESLWYQVQERFPQD